jgi:hypothetical protein
LPIGVIPVLNDPPAFNPTDPNFNVFRIANLVENPPWNLALTSPPVPSSDVTLDISQNSLTMNLGDLANVFPAGPVRAYGASNGPTMGFSIRRMFVALAPEVEFENDLRLNDALTGVLRNGEALAPNTHYAVTDHGRAQAAAALHVGMALPVASFGDPRHGGSALYAGARFKLLRGLAYGDADNIAAYDTGDTLFGSNGLDLRYTGRFHDATPDGGGWGSGVDAGAVWTLGALEMGVAMDDIGTRIPWKLRETVAYRDSASGDYKTQVVGENESFTSEIPATMVANAAWHAGRWLAAGDVRRNVIATTAHAGLERWLGPVGLRAGGALDANQRVQYSGGVGLQFGRLGLDLAVATHNRNLENRRALELGVGLEMLR